MIDVKDKLLLFPFILISLVPITLITGPAIPDLSITASCIIFIYFVYKKKFETQYNTFFIIHFFFGFHF